MKNNPMIESRRPNSIINPNIIADIIKKEPSRLKLSLFIFIGDISADNPNMNKTFEIFEPITLPNAIPGVGGFANNALSDADNSGKDVPTPIKIIPIINGDSFNLCASFTPLRTRTSPPVIKSTNPKQNIRYVIFSLFYFAQF